jgi:hypothetical protein
MVSQECAFMMVEWLNFRLTFQAETAEEHNALEAVWMAFGSQVDNRPGIDDEDTLESRKLINSLTTFVVT